MGKRLGLSCSAVACAVGFMFSQDAKAAGGEAMGKGGNWVGSSLSRQYSNRMGYSGLEGLPLQCDGGQSTSSGQFCPQNTFGMVVDGQNYDQSNYFNTDVGQDLGSACSYLGMTGKGLCSTEQRDKAVASYSAAAATMGIPAPVLICLTASETGFKSGLTSPTGAKGLTQFQPNTADFFDKLMSKESKYREAWDQYASMGGSQKGSESFSKGNICSDTLSNSDVQIFATGMYFRYYMNDTSNYWKNHPPTTWSDFQHLVDYLLVTYNAGPGGGQKFIENGFSTSSIPAETQGYLKHNHSCLRQMMNNKNLLPMEEKI